MSFESRASNWISAFLGSGPSGATGPSPSELRASDADREQVIDLLREAAGDGRLSMTEHEERVERAYAARTLGELVGLTADLVPPDRQPFLMDGRPVVALFRTENRAGRWVVPSEVPVTSLGGRVTMDLCEALLQSRHVVVRLSVMAGTVTLVVPEGVRVVSGPDARIKSFQDEVRLPPGATGFAPDAPVIELAGFVYGGKVIARSPKRPKKGLFRRS
ncbi:DUF1707 SHOCT-like domain-containing protein [Microtetraspora niveoalba]|uniref:DUF1707 SHOCT-like domain-containing protein n=1 Tax=Microtetraspora niveoalba TaxID=46175 RepID=UPI000A6B6AC2|nr:DUF1707 domain-containing protein [Microtetraspora niveoalba]